MIRINNIKMAVTHNIDDLNKKVCKILKISKSQIKEFRISRKSIDARNKKDIFYVYSIDLSINNEKKYVNIKNVSLVKENVYSFSKNVSKQKYRPVIIGSGPAGLFSALILAENGLNPIILERGKNVLERYRDVQKLYKTGKLNEESNIQFGEGGAGAFSDGKLTTGIKDLRISKVIDEFIKHGAPEEIKYESKPHIGTDNLLNLLICIRKNIEHLGGEFRFSNKVVDFKVEENKVLGVFVEDENGNTYELNAEKVILAVGHSARSTFSVLFEKNIKMQRKAFAVGMRIEHKQIEINKSQYGDFYNKLEPATYKLNHKTKNGMGVYTFCMCPGGTVVAATSEKNKVVTNGMSFFNRAKENANSAILIGISPKDFEDDDVFAGIKLQTKLEEMAFDLGGGNYKAPVQLLGDFMLGKETKELGNVLPSYRPGFTLSDLTTCFSSEVVNAFKESILEFDKKLKGFNTYDAVLTGLETRSSSPITILRNENMESSISGIYPCGEGGGHAGGIMSAAVDGIKCAENIILSVD